MRNNLLIKVLLIIVAEAIAFVVTQLISNYIIHIPHTTATYIISGGVLAYFIVVQYDKYIDRKKQKIQNEIKVLTDVTLQKYNVKEDNS